MGQISLQMSLTKSETKREREREIYIYRYIYICQRIREREEKNSRREDETDRACKSEKERKKERKQARNRERERAWEGMLLQHGGNLSFGMGLTKSVKTSSAEFLSIQWVVRVWFDCGCAWGSWSGFGFRFGQFLFWFLKSGSDGSDSAFQIRFLEKLFRPFQFAPPCLFGGHSFPTLCAKDHHNLPVGFQEEMPLPLASGQNAESMHAKGSKDQNFDLKNGRKTVHAMIVPQIFSRRLPETISLSAKQSRNSGL